MKTGGDGEPIESLTTAAVENCSFHDFVDAVLEPLARLKGDYSTDIGQYLRSWLQKTASAGIPVFSWLSLLLPEEDVYRKYHMQQKTLAKLLIPLLGWSNSEEGEQLDRWQEPICSNDVTAGDFSLRLEFLLLKSSSKLAQTRAKSSESAGNTKLSLVNIQKALTELATYCPFSNRTPIECRWLVRVLLKDMKLPFDTSRLLRSIDQRLHSVYQLRNSLPAACSYFEQIFKAKVDLYLSEIRTKWLVPEMGTNIAIMSCAKCTGTADIEKCFAGQTVAAEIKYDGERLQVHLSRSAEPSDHAKIWIYSKSKRNSTEERRHAHELLKASFGMANDEFYERKGILPPRHTTSSLLVQSVIAEAEIVTFDERTRQVEMFGSVRHFEPKPGDSKHFKVIWFDLLFLNGKTLLDRPYYERRRLLERLIRPIGNYIGLSEMRPFSWSFRQSANRFIQYYSDRVFAGRDEGIILKPWGSRYIPGSEGVWMKLKQDYIEGIGDTADFAVVGAYMSKRTASKFTANQQRLGGIMGSFLVASIENKHELKKPFSRAKLRVVLVVENGFSEFQIHRFHSRSLSRTVDVKPGRLGAVMQSLSYDLILGKSGINQADIRFLFDKPFVFELLGSGFVKEGADSFYSLRFPRIVKERTDIEWKDAISFEEYQAMDPAARDRAQKRLGKSATAHPMRLDSVSGNGDLHPELECLANGWGGFVFFHDQPIWKQIDYDYNEEKYSSDSGVSLINIIFERRCIIYAWSAVLVLLGCYPCQHSGLQNHGPQDSLVIFTRSRDNLNQELQHALGTKPTRVYDHIRVVEYSWMNLSCSNDWINVQLGVASVEN